MAVTALSSPVSLVPPASLARAASSRSWCLPVAMNRSGPGQVRLAFDRWPPSARTRPISPPGRPGSAPAPPKPSHKIK
jgi:hypothetical protein